jgi:ferrous-iron efflux pump FieF
MPADDDHRFGHQKAEAASALVQAFIISGSAVFVTVESVRRLVAPVPVDRPGAAVWVLAGATVATSALVAFQTVALRRSGSLVVEGDRAHYVGDVLANLGALIGVLLAARGVLRADAVAGLIAAGFLFWSVAGILSKSWPQIMDRELPEEEQRRILAVLRADPDVLGHHDLRTRRAGRRRYVQVHIDLEPEMTLREAHEIAVRLERRLEGAFPETDVIVHQDPAGAPH